MPRSPRRSALFLLLTIIAGPGSAQISLKDDLGNEIRLRTPAQRVISLAPSITESLFAIGAGDQVVGVTDYCNAPQEALNKQRVGGMTNPSIEGIIALQPDLIIVSMEGNLREDYDRLVRLGSAVFVTNPRTLDGIYHSLQQLGTLTGRTAEAAQLTSSLMAREDSIRARVTGPKVRTLFVVSFHPLIVVGRNTFLNQLLEAAGAQNLAASIPATYPTYSREELAAQDPEAILVMADLLRDPRQLPELFPEWKRLRAVRENRVVRVDADLVSRPGPRAVDGLATLHSLLHPQRP